MKHLSILSALALTMAAPAFAQDNEVPAEAPAKDSLTGFSIAAFAGIDVLTIQENNAADAQRGVLFGGSIGYDMAASDRVIVGVQGEITSSQASYDVEDLLTLGDSFSSSLGRDIYGGVRVGLRAGPHTLIYVGGGYVSSQIKSEYTDNTGTLSQKETKGGFRLSLGGEYGKKNLFGRVEMRYQDLGDYTIFGVPTGFARTNTQIVAGVGVRF